MTLREEITKCLQSYLLPEYDEPDTFTPEITFEMCDAVVRIFEQKIDEKIRMFESYGNIKDFNYSDEYYGVIKGLKLIKQEIEK
ncbi:MAG: hypothetical protein R3321_02360 [Nitrososphaeraceae archaeon]|nr:hypothetical protein [Nitrososphaeraceae archaeon]